MALLLSSLVPVELLSGATEELEPPPLPFCRSTGAGPDLPAPGGQLLGISELLRLPGEEDSVDLTLRLCLLFIEPRFLSTCL